MTKRDLLGKNYKEDSKRSVLGFKKRQRGRKEKETQSPVIIPVWDSLRKLAGCSESWIGRMVGSRNRRKMTVGSPHLGDCVK